MTTTQTHQEWYAAETARWAAIEGARSRLLAALAWRTIPAQIARAAARTDLTPAERVALRSLAAPYVHGSSLDCERARDELVKRADRVCGVFCPRDADHPFARLQRTLDVFRRGDRRYGSTVRDLADRIHPDAESIARGELVVTAADGRAAWTLAEQAVLA